MVLPKYPSQKSYQPLSSICSSVTWSFVANKIQKTFNQISKDSPDLLSSQNAERIVEKLSKIRGAALKLGQMVEEHYKLEVTTPPK